MLLPGTKIGKSFEQSISARASPAAGTKLLAFVFNIMKGLRGIVQGFARSPGVANPKDDVAK